MWAYNCFVDFEKAFASITKNSPWATLLSYGTEKAMVEKNKWVYNCFVDFEKAFDSMTQNITWLILQSHGTGGS